MWNFAWIENDCRLLAGLQTRWRPTSGSTMRSVSPPASTETIVTSPERLKHGNIGREALLALAREADVARADADHGRFACFRRLAASSRKAMAQSRISRAALSCGQLALDHVHVGRADLARHIEIDTALRRVRPAFRSAPRRHRASRRFPHPSRGLRAHRAWHRRWSGRTGGAGASVPRACHGGAWRRDWSRARPATGSWGGGSGSGPSATRCCSPPDSVLGLRSIFVSSRSIAAVSFTRRSISSRGDAFLRSADRRSSRRR